MHSPEMSLLSNIISRLYLNATQLSKQSAALFLVLFFALFLFGVGLQSTAAQVTTGDVLTENADNSDFNIRRVGTIDISAVLRASEATEKVRRLLDGKRAEFKEEFAQKEAELVLKEQELQSKR
ncbi:MAG: hypothetical protein P8P76_04495, partial [Alphaproteobacteria bacterium]|nr:hypothetical protein [Alphaproteobacteria bacterium]